MTTKLPPPTTHPLFAGVAIEEAFAAQRAKALAEIAALAPDVVLTGDLPRLRRELLETYGIHALRLEWGARSAEPGTTAGNGGGAPGSTVSVFVPFSGAPGLFEMTPTRRGGELPAAFIRPSELVLVMTVGRAEAGRELERQIALITEWVARINADVDRFNRELAATLRTRLASLERRARGSAELALGLGPPPHQPRRTRLDDRRLTRSWAAKAGGPAVTPTRRGPGRPPWPDDLLADRNEEAVAATPEPRTLAAIAAHFRPLCGNELGVTPDYLRRLIKRIETRPE